MWPSRSRTETVICTACGDQFTRSMAREYDKYGDRWDRKDKTFEYLCKPCHSDLCHHPRTDLEAILVEIGAGDTDEETFLSAYLETVEKRYGRLEEES
ncbi:DUF7562 family protein [Natronorubrum sulfidifaciens]|uniref:Small CPxCG-related zinc finger protein n=1 Tax=Natronorubrum sulfidifaciens JCM 14089 TaxID=1230460 RepID=L9WGM6_9EURY|nr:hypothetical protein [Natronorubrum sulfidifaciens]ELY47483.1 hypothetical protein C495_04467 [Natronorubrum sulfidifaciens JCM 14089]